MDARATVEAVWRMEAPRLVAALARMVRDVGLAEDLAQDALVAALERWPRDGVPDNPGAWLMTTARHRAIDLLRRDGRLRDREALLARELALSTADRDADAAGERLALAFACCHPVLSAEAQVALTLRLLGGLTTAEIARAFLIGEATVAQRVTRAKRALADERAVVTPPDDAIRRDRLPAVLKVVELVFNEGYTATAGADWMRPELCADALRLGRQLEALLPHEGEVHGLVALMELQASRTRARRGAGGEIVLLDDQDRARWDRLLIGRGLAALARAERLGLGAYGLQAAIAGCHARAPSAEATDWVRIAALYAALAQVAPSPVVELNRAVAVGRAFAPEAGLAVLEAAAPALPGNHLVPSVRGDLLARLGRDAEARAAFAEAAALARNAREGDLLRRRARAP